jgi:dipeptidyl aminopeptidase/acylaminoacyl peptidase
MISKIQEPNSNRVLKNYPSQVRHRPWTFWIKRLVLISLFVLLTACGGSDDNTAQASSGNSTPVPTPTKDPSGYQAIDPKSCLITDWSTMQSRQAQGDLIAWQPIAATPGSAVQAPNLAYLAPASRSSWFIGDLMLAKGPTFENRVELATGTYATGDLTWAPDGSRLAFTAYRANDNLYTVMVVNSDGNGLLDLFPGDAANTGDSTSLKAIVNWPSATELTVLSSCGVECAQSYTIKFADAATNTAPDVSAPTPVDDYHVLAENLKVQYHTIDIKADEFPKILQTKTPQWSPNNQMAAYMDKKDYLWLLSTDGKITYQLDIGLRNMDETQWSSDSQWLAVRAEDRIFVFEIPCRSK